jgi:hypothetical protein
VDLADWEDHKHLKEDQDKCKYHSNWYCQQAM